MYLHAPAALAESPKQQLTAKEIAKKSGSHFYVTVGRDGEKCGTLMKFTRRDWKEAMRDLAKCQKSLDAAHAALKAA
jgi:hypothetical protein